MLNSVSGDFFNTRNTITAECPPEVLEQALGMCAVFNNRLSKTVPGSDVWNLNHAGGKAVKIQPGCAEMLRMSKDLYAQSEGLFNIAMGAVIKLWHFTDGSRIIPDASALAEALKHTRIEEIQVGEDWAKLPDGVEIDLGGIAKGYIADALAGFLRSQGVKSANINLGGNVIVIGKRPDGFPWRVGLQIPTRDYTRRDLCWAHVECCDESVVISGSYERGFEKNGRWYHHILDPRSGYPIETDVLSVTVRSKSSLVADALTTPLFLLGPEKGRALAQQYGAAAAFYLEGNRVVAEREMRLILA